MLFIAAPAAAAPGFTPSFRAGGAAGAPVMAPDGTVVFPIYALVNAEIREAVQVRPPGGPLKDVQLLSAPGSTSTGVAVDVGGDGRFVAAWVEGGDVKVATLMPGSTDFTPTATLTDGTADGASVQVDGAGTAYVMWSTRDDDIGANTRTARVRLTKFPADGGSPSTSLVDENITTFAENPVLGVIFAVNDAGDAVFVKTRGTVNSTTQASTTDYTAWTQPAGGPQTLPTTLRQTTTGSDGQVNNPGESRLDSLNLNINNGGEIMASWYRGANPFNTSTVDVVNGTVAAGFGSIENPTPGDSLYYTDVTSLLDASGRTTVAVLKNIGGKIRTQVFTRPRAGTWSSAQTPIPTGDNQYSNALAGDPSGRVMLVFQYYNGPSTIVTAIAEPGQPFPTPTPLVSGLTNLQRATPAFGASGDGVLAWVFEENSAQVTDVVGYDASPPALRNLAVPASGTVGDSLAFSVQPFDIWSPVTTSWSFGDGAIGDGSSVSHSYTSPGDMTVGVTATDSFGNAATASRALTVGAAPVQQQPSAPPDKTPPAISAFAASPSVFAVGAKSTPLVAKVKRGTAFKFALSEPGAVAITIARQIPGRRSGKRCVAPTRKLRKKKACKRYKTVGTLKRTGAAGANKVAFTGKLGKRALGVGRYRATIVATDAAGNKSAAASTSFRIVPAR